MIRTIKICDKCGAEERGEYAYDWRNIAVTIADGTGSPKKLTNKE